MTPDTPFLLASASKPFTALAVTRLVERGHLSLDEPAAPHLAALTDELPDGFEDVTVGQMLDHTAGLGTYVGLAGTISAERGPHALEGRVRDLLSQPLSATPGERFAYNNAGAVLLAAIVEQQTGMSFADHLEQEIFTPLGMADSFASDEHPAAARLAIGHRQWFGTWRPADLPYDTASAAMGYIGSTARDLTSFMHAHLHGEPDNIAPTTADGIADRPAAPTGWNVPLEATHTRGWFVDELAGRRTVSHAGSLGRFTAHLILVPDADHLGIAVLSNASAFLSAGHEGQYELSIGLARLLLSEEP